MILGITGGIGSGKSTAAEILEKERHFRVLSTDAIARKLMNEDKNLRKRLSECFGSGIIAPDGTIDRKKYAQMIYSDSASLKKSDEIVHPAVWKKTEELIGRIRKEDPCADIAVETALPDMHFRTLCSRILYITADRETRIRRLMETRSYSREYAEAILAKQKNEDFYLAFSDVRLENSGSPEELRASLLKIL